MRKIYERSQARHTRGEFTVSAAHFVRVKWDGHHLNMHHQPPPPYRKIENDDYKTDRQSSLEPPSIQDTLTLTAAAAAAWITGAAYIEYVYYGVQEQIHKYIYELLALPFTIIVLGAYAYVCTLYLAQRYPTVTKYILGLPIPMAYVSTILLMATFMEVGLDMMFTIMPVGFIISFFVFAGCRHIMSQTRVPSLV
ncbi:hypothetical protein CUC08_Gglean009144 [Alternaria sp. MG1]|nr:hypothetical protein CUC08_Gglean009144 [Alternaria sp. MG1]